MSPEYDYDTVMLRIVGSVSFSPKDVDIKELYDITKSFAHTIAKLSETPIDEVKLSLLEVRNASAGFVYAPPLYLFPTITQQIMPSIESSNYSNFTRPAFEAFKKLIDVVDKKGVFLDVTVQKNNQNHSKTVTFDPKRERIEPPEDITWQGTTTIFGQCIEVGGDRRQKATIKPPQGKLIEVYLQDQSVAQELAQRLYRDVVLEGTATWLIIPQSSFDTFEMIDFVAHKVGEYNRGNLTLTEIMRELSDASGDAWDDIDPDEFVRELRRDD